MFHSQFACFVEAMDIIEVLSSYLYFIRILVFLFQLSNLYFKTNLLIKVKKMKKITMKNDYE